MRKTDSNSSRGGLHWISGKMFSLEELCSPGTGCPWWGHNLWWDLKDAKGCVACGHGLVVALGGTGLVDGLDDPRGLFQAHDSVFCGGFRSTARVSVLPAAAGSASSRRGQGKAPLGLQTSALAVRHGLAPGGVQEPFIQHTRFFLACPSEG